MASRSIPRERPQLVWQADVPADLPHDPVLAGDSLMLASGWRRPRRGAKSIDVLIALDAATGEARWHLSRPARTVVSWTPAALSGGSALFATWEERAGTIVRQLDGEGRVTAEEPSILVPGEFDDVRRSLRPLPDGRFVITGSGLECRIFGRGHVWRTAADPALLGESIAVLETGEVRLGVALEDGSERWNGHRFGRAVGVQGDWVLVWEKGRLALLDARGETVWTLERDWERVTAADVLAGPAIAVGPRRTDAGGFALEVIGFDGRPVARVPCEGPPRLAAMDHTHLLRLGDTELVCESLADPGRRVWAVRLPEPPHAFMGFDRPSLLAVDERIFLRSARCVYAWAPP